MKLRNDQYGFVASFVLLRLLAGIVIVLVLSQVAARVGFTALRGTIAADELTAGVRETAPLRSTLTYSLTNIKSPLWCEYPAEVNDIEQCVRLTTANRALVFSPAATAHSRHVNPDSEEAPLVSLASRSSGALASDVCWLRAPYISTVEEETTDRATARATECLGVRWGDARSDTENVDTVGELWLYSAHPATSPTNNAPSLDLLRFVVPADPANLAKLALTDPTWGINTTLDGTHSSFLLSSEVTDFAWWLDDSSAMPADQTAWAEWINASPRTRGNDTSPFVSFRGEPERLNDTAALLTIAVCTVSSPCAPAPKTLLEQCPLNDFTITRAVTNEDSAEALTNCRDETHNDSDVNTYRHTYPSSAFYSEVRSLAANDGESFLRLEPPDQEGRNEIEISHACYTEREDEIRVRSLEGRRVLPAGSVFWTAESEGAALPVFPYPTKKWGASDRPVRNVCAIYNEIIPTPTQTPLADLEQQPLIFQVGLLR